MSVFYVANFLLATAQWLIVGRLVMRLFVRDPANAVWQVFLDYQFVTPSLRGALRACEIHPTPRFSDHAPFAVDYAL